MRSPFVLRRWRLSLFPGGAPEAAPENFFWALENVEFSRRSQNSPGVLREITIYTGELPRRILATAISGRNYKNALCAHKLCVKYFLCNSIISSSSIIIILTFSDSLSLDLLEFLLIFCFTLWLRRKAQKTWLFRIWRGHFRNIGLKWGHFCKIPKILLPI